MRTVFERCIERTSAYHFYHSKDTVNTWQAHEILQLALACAHYFCEAGLRPGDTVATSLLTSPEKIASIIGAWGCGATVCVLPYAEKIDKANTENKFRDLLDLIKPKLFVHDDYSASIANQLPFQNRVNSALLLDALAKTSTSDLVSKGFPSIPEPQHTAIVQLTSGSSGLSKGVPLTHAQIAANCAAIAQRALANATDHLVSWLPVYHDMGLGAVTLSIWADAQLTLITPKRFVQSPLSWLEALSIQRGTLSPSPAFALALLSKFATRLKPNEIDLSTWRYAWVGAEPVFDRHLKAFELAMGQFGLNNTVLKPSFGMAEAVVAVTCGDPAKPYVAVHIDKEIYNQTRQVRLTTYENESTLTFVSNGPALENLTIKIIDQNGTDLGESREGRLLIRGASVTAGYLNGADIASFAHDGWFDTGDLGFLINGELFISGRAKDLITRGGVNTSPERIEGVIEDFLDLRQGRVVAFSIINTATAKEEIVVIVSKKISESEIENSTNAIFRLTVKEVGVQIDRLIFSTASKLPLTSSGKLRRSTARQMYLNKKFSPEILET
jgi:fatty-acyl-CoA synthase